MSTYKWSVGAMWFECVQLVHLLLLFFVNVRQVCDLKQAKNDDAIEIFLLHKTMFEMKV